MFPRGFLDRSYKKRGDNSKESRVSSDNVGAVDVLREASRQAEVKPSREKVQQRDVGSSSEAGKMVAIPENFKRLGGNTDLAEAKVILLGEAHISQHNKDIVDFINAHAKDGDIVLVEGEQTGKELDRVEFALRNAFTLGDLAEDQWEQARMKPQDELQNSFSRWCAQGVVRPFTKDVKIYGWDEKSIQKELLLLRGKYDELSEKKLQEKEGALLYPIEMIPITEKIRELHRERDEYMLRTINNMRKKFPNKRIFTIAGRDHVLRPLKKIKDMSYIAIMPKYELTEKDREDYKRMNN